MPYIDSDIEKASLQQKIISMSVLQDKIEQIRGVTQSMTDNQINILINNVINNYVANNTQPADITISMSYDTQSYKMGYVNIAMHSVVSN